MHTTTGCLISKVLFQHKPAFYHSEIATKDPLNPRACCSCLQELSEHRRLRWETFSLHVFTGGAVLAMAAVEYCTILEPTDLTACYLQNQQLFCCWDHALGQADFWVLFTLHNPPSQFADFQSWQIAASATRLHKTWALQPEPQKSKPFNTGRSKCHLARHLSPNYDNTHHYQMLVKAVGFIGSSNVNQHHPKSPAAAITAGVRDHCCLHCFLPFFYKTHWSWGSVWQIRGRDEEHIVEFFIQSIYCNLESSAAVEGLILQ